MAITPIVFTGATKDTIKSAFQKCNNMATDYAAATSGKGASLIGVYDSADNMAATNVEDALAEIYTDVSSARTMAKIFSTKASTTTGLTWGYYGGNIRTDNEVTAVEDGTVTLTDDATNYVEVAADGSVYASATSFTSERIPLWIIVCADGEQTTYTDRRAWFPTWPNYSSLLVSGLKVIRNTTSVNCLEIFESSTGVAPTANTPIKVHIPNGTGYTVRTRSQAELSGGAKFTLADATGYWGYASANGSSYPAFVYAIWSASDECIVWGLSNVVDLTLCPTGETETASGYMLLEDGSTYTRTGTDFCVAVAKVEFEYDTGDTPDYTFATSASGKNIIIYGSEFSVDFRKLPLGYLSGLTIAHAADTEHDITVAAGEARDATDAADMVLASAITKRFDAEWAVGDAAGGFAAGESLPASGTIHIWLIKRSDTGVVDVMANNHATSALAPSLPADYDYKRRIFSLRTNADNNIINGDQWGTGLIRTWMYDTPILDVTATNPGTNAVSVALSVPNGIIVSVLGILGLTRGTSTNVMYVSALANTDLAPSATAAPLANWGLSNPYPNSLQDLFSNTSGQVRYRIDVSGAADVVRIATYGWRDSL